MKIVALLLLWVSGQQHQKEPLHTIEMKVIYNCLEEETAFLDNTFNSSYVGILVGKEDTVRVITEDPWGDLTGKTISCIVDSIEIVPTCHLFKPTGKMERGYFLTAPAFETIPYYKGVELIKLGD